MWISLKSLSILICPPLSLNSHAPLSLSLSLAPSVLNVRLKTYWIRGLVYIVLFHTSSFSLSTLFHAIHCSPHFLDFPSSWRMLVVINFSFLSVVYWIIKKGFCFQSFFLYGCVLPWSKLMVCVLWAKWFFLQGILSWVTFLVSRFASVFVGWRIWNCSLDFFGWLSPFVFHSGDEDLKFFPLES